MEIEGGVEIRISGHGIGIRKLEVEIGKSGCGNKNLARVMEEER